MPRARRCRAGRARRTADERPRERPVLLLEPLEHRQHLVVDELVGRLADQPMLVAEALRREDAGGVGVFDQPAAAVNCGGRSRGGHDESGPDQRRSKIPAAPIPPPTHIVTSPYRASRRRISWSSVAVSLAPVHPSGWPSAIAPPLTLRRRRIDRQLAQAGDRLRGERLVELDEVDLLERQAGHLQDFSDRRHRSDAEALGLDTRGRERDEACERREPGGPRVGFFHDDHGRGAVARLRRVAGGHGALDVKGGPQLGERLERRIAARPFVQ